jgi:hypothetical protein
MSETLNIRPVVAAMTPAIDEAIRIAPADIDPGELYEIVLHAARGALMLALGGIDKSEELASLQVFVARSIELAAAVGSRQNGMALTFRSGRLADVFARGLKTDVLMGAFRDEPTESIRIKPKREAG